MYEALGEGYLKKIAYAKARHEKPYLPSQDTKLLRRSVKEYTGGSALEIGFGSGSVTEELSKNFKLVVGTELILHREQFSSLGGPWHRIIADRATCFRSSIFDLVVFNPPYLPSDSIEDITVDGGGGGVEIPLLFLDEALRVIRRDGKALMVISNAGEIARMETRCRAMGLRFRIIAEEDLFYESLYVYEIKWKEEGL